MIPRVEPEGMLFGKFLPSCIIRLLLGVKARTRAPARQDEAEGEKDSDWNFLFSANPFAGVKRLGAETSCPQTMEKTIAAAHHAIQVRGWLLDHA